MECKKAVLAKTGPKKNGVRSYAVTGNLSSRLKSCPGNCPFIPVAPQSSIRIIPTQNK